MGSGTGRERAKGRGSVRNEAQKIHTERERDRTMGKNKGSDNSKSPTLMRTFRSNSLMHQSASSRQVSGAACYFAPGRGAKYCDKHVCLSVHFRLAVDMDIHGYIHGYIHVWISDIGCPMYISMDIFTYFNLNCHITSYTSAHVVAGGIIFCC